jgi:hypothetical protein
MKHHQLRIAYVIQGLLKASFHRVWVVKICNAFIRLAVYSFLSRHARPIQNINPLVRSLVVAALHKEVNFIVEHVCAC